MVFIRLTSQEHSSSVNNDFLDIDLDHEKEWVQMGTAIDLAMSVSGELENITDNSNANDIDVQLALSKALDACEGATKSVSDNSVFFSEYSNRFQEIIQTLYSNMDRCLELYCEHGNAQERLSRAQEEHSTARRQCDSQTIQINLLKEKKNMSKLNCH